MAATTTATIAPATNTRNIHYCQHCGRAYDWRKNVSNSLKMTYCTSMCEAAELGFTIEALLHATGPRRDVTAPSAPR